MNILKRLFCKHAYEFVRNIYGDEIRYLGWKRSVWNAVNAAKSSIRKILNNKVMKQIIDYP